jgi:hypothetical protein
MKVIDNFLPSAYQDSLHELMLGDNFPWYLNKSTTLNTSNTVNQQFESGQFTHTFFKDEQISSQFFQRVEPILYYLMLSENKRTDSLIRIKANLNYQNSLMPVGGHYPLHMDSNKETNYTTCVYYVNDSDGDTLFFSSDLKTETARVSPKKGRLVMFDGNTLHAGQAPKTNEVRCVINLNFKNI